MIVMFLMYRSADDIELLKRYGLVIIGIIAISVIKNLSIIIIIAVRSNYIKLRGWVHKKVDHEKNKAERLAKERVVKLRKIAEKKEYDRIMSEYDRRLKSPRAAIPNTQSLNNQGVIGYNFNKI